MYQFKVSYFPVSFISLIVAIYLIAIDVNRWYVLIPLSIFFLERLYVQVMLWYIDRARRGVAKEITKLLTEINSTQSQQTGGLLGGQFGSTPER
jgi:hypothetical protein